MAITMAITQVIIIITMMEIILIFMDIEIMYQVQMERVLAVAVEEQVQEELIQTMKHREIRFQDQ